MKSIEIKLLVKIEGLMLMDKLLFDEMLTYVSWQFVQSGQIVTANPRKLVAK